ncbi:MAG: LysR family transcriptional regulator, partial [Proteobacteria bacterium]|nr:LysR family transcriptional regulator [Pseudomonadota bacterium]
MQYTLKQLQNLISVSEHGSISAAASHLFISQPALSTSIA